MTNREWLNSLSNEDFAKWCLDGEIWNGNGFEQPTPKLGTIKYQYTQSKSGLLVWLDEDRSE